MIFTRFLDFVRNWFGNPVSFSSLDDSSDQSGKVADRNKNTSTLLDHCNYLSYTPKYGPWLDNVYMGYRFPTVLDALLEVQEIRCIHCKKEMILDENQQQRKRHVFHLVHTRKRPRRNGNLLVTRDHIVPVAVQRLKGWHIPIDENVVLSCAGCNSKRGHTEMTPEALIHAKETNRKALDLYRNELCPSTDAFPRIWSRASTNISKINEREIKDLQGYPREQWLYLFTDEVKMVRKRKTLGRISANEFRQMGVGGESRDGHAINLPVVHGSRIQPQPVVNVIFPTNHGEKEFRRGSFELALS